MTAAALTPEAAVAWLGSLSVDLRAVAVLDASGALLAGDPELAPDPATASGDAPTGGSPMAGEAGRAGGRSGPADGERIVVSSARHTAAAVVGAQALRRLVSADLRAAVEALDRA